MTEKYWGEGWLNAHAGNRIFKSGQWKGAKCRWCGDRVVQRGRKGYVCKTCDSPEEVEVKA